MKEAIKELMVTANNQCTILYGELAFTAKEIEAVTDDTASQKMGVEQVIEYLEGTF